MYKINTGKLWNVGRRQRPWLETLGSIPCLGRSPGEGNGNPLRYSCLENIYSPWGHRVGHNLVTERPPPISGGQLFSWKVGQWIKWTVCTNKPILKEINPEYTLEGLVLKLKLQNLDYLMQRADSLEKTLMLGKTEGRRSRGWQRMRWLDGIIDSMDMSLRKFRETVKDSKDWHATVHGVAKSPIKLSDLCMGPVNTIT